MSILSVDNISPIGSGTSVTVNNAATLVVNNVGISGVTTITGDLSIADKIVHTGDTDTAIRFPQNDTITAETGGSEKMRLTADGKLGIGTVTPAHKLDVIDGIINVGAAVTTNDSRIQFTRNDTGMFGWIGIPNWNPNSLWIYGPKDVSPYNEAIAQYESEVLKIYTGGTERLGITSSGILLLGTSTETNNIRLGNKFGIAGTTLYTGMSISNYAGTAGAAGPLIDFNRSRGTSDGSMTTVATNDKLGELIFRGSNGSAFADAVTLRGYAGTVSGSNVNGIYEISTSNAGSMTVRLRVDENGYVTKPNHPSFLAGRSEGNYTATIGTFPFNVARINVGNHYSTSTYKFTAPVAGVYYFYAQVYYNNGNGNYRVGFRKEPSGGSAFMLNTAAHSMVGNDNSQTLSIIESLSVGDTVRLFSDQNSSIQCYYGMNNATYGAHTYFMGYLIG